jgi:hypothetical protein
LSQIAANLKAKLEKSEQVVIDEESVILATKKVIKATRHPGRQLILASEFYGLKPQSHKLIRDEIDLACDLIYFAQRPMRLLLQSLDGERLGMIFSALGLDTQALVQEMPEAMVAVFQDTIRREFERHAVEQAWQEVQATLQDLVSTGLITKLECQHAKDRADGAVLAPEFARIKTTATAPGHEGVEVVDHEAA